MPITGKSSVRIKYSLCNNFAIKFVTTGIEFSCPSGHPSRFARKNEGHTRGRNPISQQISARIAQPEAIQSGAEFLCFAEKNFRK